MGDQVPLFKVGDQEPLLNRECRQENDDLEIISPVLLGLTAEDVTVDFAARMAWDDLGRLLWGAATWTP